MTEPTTIDEAFVRDLVKRWGEAVNAGDVEALLALCVDDVVMIDPALPAPAQGKPAVREAIQTIFSAFPDFHVEQIGSPLVSLNGETVGIHWSFNATMTGRLDPPGFAPTNGPVEGNLVDLLQLRDGRVSRFTVVLDMLSLGRQIGAAPPPGSVGERLGAFVQNMTARRMRRRARN
jgi:steroid delta-isomerase-like uncharacterized protein